MVVKTFITEDSYYFKAGQLVEGKCIKNGLLVEDHFLTEGSYVVLNETLTSQDEEKVKSIIRDLLKRWFWRNYTRSNFVLK